MNFRNLADDRYTTKKYDPTKKIPEAVVTQLKEILRLSPSSINSQPWRFTFIAKQEVKEQLAGFSRHNSERVIDASHVVVFSVIDRVELLEQQIAENLPELAMTYFTKYVKPQGDEQIKNWMAHQVYLSLGFFLSGAASLGVDSTPMEGIEAEAYDRILGLQDYKTLFAVALGYRDPNDVNQPAVKPKLRIDLDKVVFSI